MLNKKQHLLTDSQISKYHLNLNNVQTHFCLINEEKTSVVEREICFKEHMESSHSFFFHIMYTTYLFLSPGLWSTFFQTLYHKANIPLKLFWDKHSLLCLILWFTFSDIRLKGIKIVVDSHSLPATRNSQYIANDRIKLWFIHFRAPPYAGKLYSLFIN